MFLVLIANLFIKKDFPRRDEMASRFSVFLPLGYAIHQAAVKAQVSEKQYREELRKAYLQLASRQLDHESPSSHEVGESALA
jgi:hypothetical protein